MLKYHGNAPQKAGTNQINASCFRIICLAITCGCDIVLVCLKKGGGQEEGSMIKEERVKYTDGWMKRRDVS